MRKAIEIVNKQGNILRGYFDLPTNFFGELVIFFHGFTGNKTEHGGMFRDFSRMLSKEGYASLRMDFFGNGESDGEFKDFTYDTLVDDGYAIVEHVKRMENINTITLLGYSMGGALAAYLAPRLCNDIDKLLLWSPAGNLSKLIKTRYEVSLKKENGNVDSPNFEISKEMYNSLFKYNWHSGIENYHKPVKIIHGQLDLAVNYLESNYYCELFSNAVLKIIEGAGHGYDQSKERECLFKESLKFIRGEE